MKSPHARAMPGPVSRGKDLGFIENSINCYLILIEIKHVKNELISEWQVSFGWWLRLHYQLLINEKLLIWREIPVKMEEPFWPLNFLERYILINFWRVATLSQRFSKTYKKTHFSHIWSIRKYKHSLHTKSILLHSYTLPFESKFLVVQDIFDSP